ncbi:uncharacterized protein LOC107488512 [Arachis duranensis]|uniref:Uncharacterized protein LOC107488512 n=1 Tax=Arachis duranensis TaxID=130453 RepID=A0A6P4DEA6_ARADU|nr:uncharacterized protein LOC107488512 [Arachis duranensis]
MVDVGNGELLRCEGEIKEVPIVVQDHCLCISTYLLPIILEELVLGDSWLEALDTHLANYREKFIMFLAGDHLVRQLPVEEDPSPLVFPLELAPDLAESLHGFLEVFRPPKGLPSKRAHDHHISLISSTTPMKISKQGIIKFGSPLKIATRLHLGFTTVSMNGYSDWPSYLTHLCRVLSVLRYNYLVAKLSKCSFGQRSIDYLGHIVSGKGVLVDDAKVSDIKNWPIPTSVRQLWGFLGLASYYRKFIKNFSMMASPLTDLLQKESFCWSNSAEEAFNTLKNALMNAPVLATIFL